MYKSFILVLSCLLSVVSACFITNCPMGGKRSGVEDKTLLAARQCSVCGPRGSGRCYGPFICCGPEMGCRMSLLDNAVCQLEEAFPVPCVNEGAPCGQTINGKCAADGLCCASDQCILDESCKQPVNTSHRHRSNSLAGSGNLLELYKAETGRSFT